MQTPLRSLWLVCTLLLLHQTVAYPVLLQVEEESERCFQFQIPEGDDAHMVATILPADLDDGVESWFFEQLYKMTARKNNVITKQFDDEQPSNVAEAVSQFFQQVPSNNGAPVTVGLTNRPYDRRGENQYHSKYFAPIVVNYIARTTYKRSERKGLNPEDDIEGYMVCVNNRSEDAMIQFVMDIVLISEDIPPDLAAESSGFSKDRHLTPLEESLEESIKAAENILREMKFMEKRERRMRRTSDHINTRVHWFSYLSISILLAVTYIQVSYLKRYFHKKKLM